jgi:CRISPR-associated endonuclease/helicase Cas3
LQVRLQAKKAAELKEVTNVPHAAAEEAARAAKGGVAVVGVVLNTVAAARAAFEFLEGDKVLLTGRVRPFDRDRLIEKYLDRMRAGRDRSGNAPLFVLATQTIEVGADLDFDSLITEAAPLNALRQRFGRLDRLGELQSTRSVILKPKRAKDTDWIYGEATQATWDWLVQRGSPVDFGILAMRDAPPGLGQAPEHAPLMFPAHVDAWAETNPSPAADPDVAPFLHGPGALETGDV